MYSRRCCPTSKPNSAGVRGCIQLPGISSERFTAFAARAPTAVIWPRTAVSRVPAYIRCARRSRWWRIRPRLRWPPDTNYHLSRKTRRDRSVIPPRCQDQRRIAEENSIANGFGGHAQTIIVERGHHYFPECRHVFRSRERGAEQSFKFRRDAIASLRNGVHAGLAQQRAQFVRRQESHRGGIAHALEAIEGVGLCFVRRGDPVANDNRSTRPRDPDHLLQRGCGVQHVAKRKPAGDDVKAGVGKR